MAAQSIIRRVVPKAHASGHRCAVVVVQKVAAHVSNSAFAAVEPRYRNVSDGPTACVDCVGLPNVSSLPRRGHTIDPLEKLRNSRATPAMNWTEGVRPACIGCNGWVPGQQRFE